MLVVYSECHDHDDMHALCSSIFINLFEYHNFVG